MAYNVSLVNTLATASKSARNLASMLEQNRKYFDSEMGASTVSNYVSGLKEYATLATKVGNSVVNPALGDFGTGYNYGVYSDKCIAILESLRAYLNEDYSRVGSTLRAQVNQTYFDISKATNAYKTHVKSRSAEKSKSKSNLKTKVLPSGQIVNYRIGGVAHSEDSTHELLVDLFMLEHGEDAISSFE